MDHSVYFYCCRELLANLTCMTYILGITGGIIFCCVKTFDPETTEVGGQRTTAVLDDQCIKLDWSQYYFCCPRAATPFPFSPLHLPSSSYCRQLLCDQTLIPRLSYQ